MMRGPPATSPGPFATAPDDALIHIISFLDPASDQLRCFAAISSRCQALVIRLLTEKAEEICTQCSTGDFCLYRSIARLPEGGALDFHRSVVDLIRSYTIDCPNAIFSSAEVHSFREQVEMANGMSLEKVWPDVREYALQVVRYQRDLGPVAPIPAADAPPWEIGSWMRAHTELLGHKRSLSLNYCELTSLPEETGLLTGLESLDLEGNLLRSLPSNLFHRCARLETLSLCSNRLSSLSPLAFNGLSELRNLTLSHNPLHSLSPNLFQSMTRLERLDLGDTHLRSLSPVLFRGLTCLDRIHADHGMLFFSQHLPVHIHISPQYNMRKEMDAFFNYWCRTPFAQFYQFVAGDSPPEAVKASFFRLHDEIKKVFFRMAWDEFHRPDPNYYQWGVERVFDDRQTLTTVLQRVVGLSGCCFSTHPPTQLSCHDLPRHENNAEFGEAKVAFRHPVNKLLFEELYRLATGNGRGLEVFYKLDIAIKKVIVRMFWDEFHRDAGYCRWGEEHLFDDMQFFHSFLIRCVNERRVCDLPGETILERIDSVDFEPPVPPAEQLPADDEPMPSLVSVPSWPIPQADKKAKSG